MTEPDPEQIEWLQNAKRHAVRRMVLGSLVQLSMLAGFAVLLIKSHVSGRHLLFTAGTWFIAVCSWLFMSPSGIWGWKVKTRNRTDRALVLALVYGSAWLHSFFTYGWLIPLGIGIYRALRS